MMEGEVIQQKLRSCMFSVEDFIAKYKEYSDEELFEAYSDPDSYSAEAKKALHVAIKNKGGLEKLMQRLEHAKIISDEEQWIANETAKLNVDGTDTSFLKKLISSTILSVENVHEIIDNTVDELHREKEDKKIKPRQ